MLCQGNLFFYLLCIFVKIFCCELYFSSIEAFASVGYNGFPRGVKDDAEKYLDRNEKYPHILHSEWNALADCKDPSVEGYGVYALEIKSTALMQ